MKRRNLYLVAVFLLAAALAAWWIFRVEKPLAPSAVKTSVPTKTWEQKFNCLLPLSAEHITKTQSLACGGFVVWKNIDAPPPKELQEKILDAVNSELEEVDSADLQEDKSAQARSRLESKMRDAFNGLLKTDKADFEIDSVKISQFELLKSH